MLSIQNLLKGRSLHALLSQESTRCLSVLARSWLFSVNTHEGFVKASKATSDVVVLDLEDAVPRELKAKTRQEYVKALQDGVFEGRKVFVRLNPVDDYDEVLQDTRLLSRREVSGFLLPKIDGYASLEAYEELVAVAETRNSLTEGSLKFVPIMETASSFFEAEQIARGSRRNVGLMVGSFDFMAETECVEHSSTYNAFLSQVVLASRAAQIQPYGGVCDKIDDHISCEKFYRKMRGCGFVGAAALTPTQATQANIEFSYSQKEVHWARQVMLLEGLSTYQPSVQESRQIIGPPHRLKASAICQHTEQVQERLTAVSEASQRTLLPARSTAKGLKDVVQIGQSMQSPLEVTVTESWRTLWECSFLTVNRLATSAQLASKLGLQSIPLPFTLLKTLALALTVTNFSDSARVQLGCYNAVQNTPLYPGDTVRCMYRVDDAMTPQSRDGGRYTVVHSSHRMVNQHDQDVFTLHKRTMFPALKIERPHQQPEGKPFIGNTSDWERFIVNRPTNLFLPMSKQPVFSAGDLIVHTDSKSFGHSETAMLCKLFKITNEHHHNITRYSSSDILVPGPLVLAAMASNTERDIGHVLYEEYPESSNINKVNFGDQIGTLTYVVSIKRVVKNNTELEEITLKHLGVKNVHLNWLLTSGVPQELFSGQLTKPAQYERLCETHCPLLYRKIACQAVRKIIRVRSW